MIGFESKKYFYRTLQVILLLLGSVFGLITIFAAYEASEVVPFLAGASMPIAMLILFTFLFLTCISIHFFHECGKRARHYTVAIPTASELLDARPPQKN